MRVLRRVELSGLSDGRRAVRLLHEGGETRAIYREGAGTGEALLAIGDGGRLFAELATALGGDGVATVTLADPCAAAARAAIAFLEQRGATRVVIAGEEGSCATALEAAAGAAAVALVFPGAADLERPAPEVPVLVVLPPGHDLLARRVSLRFARATVVADGGPGVPALVRTFVLDALAGGPCALEI